MTFEMAGAQVELISSPALFSPTQVDAGTRAMLCTLQLEHGQRILDLGCGCGVVGLWAAKIVGQENVVMLDVDKLAIQIARQNAKLNGLGDVSIVQSDGFAQLDLAGFDFILCNPPYHEDYKVAKHFIEKGFNRLVIGGQLVMVVKRALWYENKLKRVFGGVKVQQINGYTVLTAQRRTMSYAKKQKK